MTLAWLVCGHVVSVRTSSMLACPSEKCPACGSFRDVERYVRETWHSKCRQCTYSRDHGLVKAYAERAANGHHARTGHEVNVQFYMLKPPNMPDAIDANVPRLFEYPLVPPF